MEHWLFKEKVETDVYMKIKSILKLFRKHLSKLIVK